MLETARVSAFRDDALGDGDATEVARRVAAGEVSPFEVVTAAIERARAVEPVLHGLVWPDFERAVRRASGPLPPGVFSGVPTAVKDNVSLAGLPQCEGSRAVASVPVQRDGAFVRQFLALGVVPIGKSAMPEFGFSASTEFVGCEPTRNPWNPAYSAGASSGGSAALVAAGVVPIAHANDGGGSIRIPAAACGLVGLKPTRDRLRTDEGHAALPIRIVAEGVLARSVRDVAGFFAGAESVWRNPRLSAMGHVTTPIDRALRIGVLIDSPASPPTDAATRAVLKQTTTLLESLGHRLEPVPAVVPSWFARDFASYWALLGYGVLTRGARLYPQGFDPSKLEPLTIGLAQTFRREKARAPIVLARLRTMGARYDRQFRRFDVLLSPVLSHTTPLLGHLAADQAFETHFQRLLDYVGFTPLHNAAGAPAVSLPLGTTAEGMPVGMQFSSKRGADALLLELALQLEAAHPWPRLQDPATFIG